MNWKSQPCYKKARIQHSTKLSNGSYRLDYKVFRFVLPQNAV